MARRIVALNAPLTLAGAVSAALILVLTLGTLGAVAWRAEGAGMLGPAAWQAVAFTVKQAALSALISVALAVPVARALARRSFAGRRALVALMGAPFILPVIVAVLGLVAVFGHSGFVNAGLRAIGLPDFTIYGLQGILIAHVFFNLPLATRLILQGWMAIPAEHFRLAAMLGFGPRDMFRVVEAPMLREIVPGALAVIFVICTTSFAVALALGGGPAATTVELAIYQAFRFDFDLGAAARLGLVQFAICALAALAAIWVRVPRVHGGGLDRVVARHVPGGGLARGIDALAILAAAVFLILPLAVIVARGLGGVAELPASVWQAAGRSMIMAVAAAVLCMMLALPLAASAVRLRRGGAVAEIIGFLSIAASPLVMGTGLYIVMFPLVNPVAWALPITVVVNAAMALPFAMRALVPAIAEVDQRFGPLVQSLAMGPWAGLRLVWWPRLRRPLGFSAGLAAALSMGDLGVIALFGAPDAATLPLQMYRLMAAYRLDDAAAAGVLLLGLSLGIFWLFDRGGRVDADA